MKMKKVNILILDSYVDVVTKTLGEMALLHLLEVEPEKGIPTIKREEAKEEVDAWNNLLFRINEAIKILDIHEMQVPEFAAVSVGIIKRKMDEIDTIITELRAKEREIDESVEELKSIYTEAETFSAFEMDPRTLNDFSFLHFAVGNLEYDRLVEIPEKSAENYILVPFHTSDGSEKLIAITDKKHRWALESDLTELGFKKEEFPESIEGLPQEVLHGVQEKLAKQYQKREKLDHEKHKYGSIYSTFLFQSKRKAETYREIAKAKMNFGGTRNTYYITGWIPEKVVDDMTRQILDATDGEAFIETESPKDVDTVKRGKESVPVMFKNPKFLRPFEMLVKGYGFPGYNEVEPTLFVALSFLIMFGLMFGDVGQGAVIALIGFWFVKSKNPAIQKLSDSGVILMGAGISSFIFGFLYGSVFGKEGLFQPLWIEPLEGIDQLFKVTIGFGIVLISIGLIVNIFNRVSRKDYMHAIFDKAGVVGVFFYWGSIFLAIKALVLKTGTIQSWEVAVFVALPLILLFFREPIYNGITRKKRLISHDIFTYIMESGVEIMETITSFLGNTVSFVRVSAFALSHAGLSLAIFKLAEILSDMPAGTFWAWFAIIFGNVLIIALEGMVVSIQTIRLEYYEFFSKFFGGQGEEFKPFELK